MAEALRFLLEATALCAIPNFAAILFSFAFSQASVLTAPFTY
jgi:hypothetical protein